ncbi:hypothetical protein VBY02_004535 [Salmonella enterica]|nr:hypothetical protein [Salmonella enterica]
MTNYESDAPDMFTTDPIEGEVSQALALYKIALIHASYRNFWHRLSCKMKDKEAIKWERLLILQEQKCREIVNQSREHREMLRIIVEQQPLEIRERDNFLNLLEQ